MIQTNNRPFKNKPLSNIQQAQFSIGWRFCPVCGHKLYQKDESCSGTIRIKCLKCGNVATVDVDPMGKRIRPDFLSQHFPDFLVAHQMKRIRFHDLHHSCASLLYANGVSLKEIQEWLGHSDINTTSNIYIHLDFSSKVSSANAIVRIFPEETKV